MDKEKKISNGCRIKNLFLRSACTADTTNSSTSFITISKTGTSGSNKGNEEPPGTPSLFDLLNKHRYERKTGTESRPKLDKNVSTRTAPIVQISIDCTGRRSLTGTNKLVAVPLPVPTKEQEEKKKKKQCNSSYNSRKCSPVSSSSPSTKFYYSNHETRRKKNATKPRGKEKKKLHSNPYGFSSSSSAQSNTETGSFSSEGEKEGETHTLFSSRSFSSDSSEFYHHTNKPKTRLNSKQSPLKPLKKPVPISKDKPLPISKDKSVAISKDKPVPISKDKKVSISKDKPLPIPKDKTVPTSKDKPVPISKDKTVPISKDKPVPISKDKTVPISKDKSKKETESKTDSNKPLSSVSSKEKKPTGTGTGTGTAVVKKSSNPYMDFRSSMVEMILEEKVVCVKEMEGLLQSYLALNAPRHHPIIVRAFEDICESIFAK